MRSEGGRGRERDVCKLGGREGEERAEMLCVYKMIFLFSSLMLTAINKDRHHGTGPRQSQTTGTRGQSSGGGARITAPRPVGGARNTRSPRRK